MSLATRIRSALSVEQRAQYYSPGVEEALFNAALSGGRADASQSAAATAAIRAISDPFAVANVTPISLASVLRPAVLVDMARRVLLTGNAVYLLDVDEIGGMSLVPASSFEVTGGYRPSSWVYRVELPRPSGDPVLRVITVDGVVHVKVGAKTVEPWRGVSPLRECGLTSEALASLDRSLGMDASPPTGMLMALPDGATQTQYDNAVTAITAGKGALSLIGTTEHGYGQGKQGAPSGPASDYRQIRFGPELSQGNVYAHQLLSSSVLNALGVSEKRFSGEGPGQREGYRLTMLGPVQALAAIVESELSATFGLSVSLDKGPGEWPPWSAPVWVWPKRWISWDFRRSSLHTTIHIHHRIMGTPTPNFSEKSWGRRGTPCLQSSELLNEN